MPVVQTPQPTDARRPRTSWDRRNIAELSQTKFRTTLRGFDRDEVRATLDSVAADYRVLQLQNASLQRQLADLEGVLRAYHRENRPVNGTALAVKPQGDHVQRANDEARAILSRAHAQAEEMMARVCAQARAVEQPFEQLEHDQRNFRAVLGATISELLTVQTMTQRTPHEDGNGHQDLAKDILANASVSRPALTGELDQPGPSDTGSSSATRNERNQTDRHKNDANDGGQPAVGASRSKTADTIEPIKTILKGIDVALVEIPALPCE
jgi:DivIVA domain-containing protein